VTADRTANATSTGRAYHRGWPTKQFDESITRLAPGLKVEVPVNEYPIRESFAQALVGFGAVVRQVVLLAEFAQANEAMLLCDMEVTGLGTLRVAEHFTVVDGKITQIRQIHDTAAIQAAGFTQGA
jgi:hypothetical protein